MRPEHAPDPTAADQHRSMIQTAMRQVLEARLRADSDASSRGDRGESRLPPDGAPDRLEGYRLEQELHRGGQGVVYRGVQRSTGRTVAVKLLARGALASRSEQLRFEREAQVLSQLEAPGIVRIVDSGVAAGHWWFAMDYIDGLPLDEYARLHFSETGSATDASPSDRARLLGVFAETAQAVHAAHLHGVIHRDLKPRNILVDQAGRPHVLDFGLAKLREDQTTEAAARTMTQPGQFVGSLPWASPEQALGNVAAVDLRTDVYSLGVILYQLLTGQFPYRVIGNPPEVVRSIATAEPAAPSTISRGIDDDLQTIVLTCLSKDAERRYQSAGDLARDLRHYLAGEPIEAKRDSIAYLIRKKLRRHRVAATVAAMFALLIAAASVTSVVLWRAAARQRDRAVEAERTQSALRGRAEAEARKSAQAGAFLQRVLAGADPDFAQGREITVREMMQTAARQLDAGQLGEEPEIEAAARHTIGQAFLSLGRFDDAAAQAQRSLAIRRRVFGPAHHDVVQSLMQLSEIRERQGARVEGLELAQQALDIEQRLHAGRDHQDVVESLRRVAWAHASQSHLREGAAVMADAVAMLERLLEPDNLRLLQARVDQMILSHDIGGSEQLLRHAIETFRVKLGPRHPDVRATLNMLGGLLQMKGDFTGAEACFREALELTEAVFGRAHPQYVEGVHHVARLLGRRGDTAAAAGLLADALPVAHQAYGEGGFGLAQYYNVLGGLQWQSGDDARAEVSLGTSLEMLRALGRDQGADAAKARVFLAQLRMERDDLAEAERLIRACLDAQFESLSEDHWTRAVAASLLGHIRMTQGDLDAAEQLLLEGCRGLESPSSLIRRPRREAIDRLVHFYEYRARLEPAGGWQGQADAWRQRLEAPGP